MAMGGSSSSSGPSSRSRSRTARSPSARDCRRLASAVAQAKAAAGDKNVAVAGGGTLVRRVIAAGLLDELELHIVRHRYAAAGTPVTACRSTSVDTTRDPPSQGAPPSPGAPPMPSAICTVIRVSQPSRNNTTQNIGLRSTTATDSV